MDIRSGVLSNRSQTLQCFPHGDFGDLGAFSLAGSRVDHGVASARNIRRVDVQSYQGLQVKLLLLESILIRVLVELECDELDNQLFERVHNRADEKGEEDVGNGGQVVAADCVRFTLISGDNKWLESYPDSKRPSNEFGISTQVANDIFVLFSRGYDGADSVSPEDREHHEDRC